MRYTVFSDIHGDYNAWKSMLDIWNEDGMLICLGDVIDGPRDIDILKEMMELDSKKFKYIWGNHELEFFNNRLIYDYELYLLKRLENDENTMNEIKDYFTYALDAFHKTKNGIFFTHAGIYTEEFNDLYGLCWNRPFEDYTREDVNVFLDNVNVKFLVSGHTPIDGVPSYCYGNQLIFHNTPEKLLYMSFNESDQFNSITELQQKTIRRIQV